MLCCFKTCAPKHWCLKLAYIMCLSVVITVVWSYATSPSTYVGLYSRGYIDDPTTSVKRDYDELRLKIQEGALNLIKSNLIQMQPSDSEEATQ